MSYADKKSVPPDDDDEIDTLSYFEDSVVADENDDDDNTDDKPATDYFKDLVAKDLPNLLREEEERKSIQATIDEIQAKQDEEYTKGLLSTRLQEMRHMIPFGVENNWMVHIWNQVVSAKLFMKNKTRNTYITKPDGKRIKKQKYRKTKESDKVSSIIQFRNRYKNPRSWQAMELKIRKIGFYALSMGDIYNANDWSSFILGNQDVDEFDDMLDNICDQLYEGFKI